MINKDYNDCFSYIRNDGKNKYIYGSITGKFEIGDIVKVKDKGKVFSSYFQMAEAMGIPDSIWNKGGILNEYIGTVCSRKIHASSHNIVYGVKFNMSSVYIIAEKGLELVNKNKMIKLFNDKDFEL